MTAVERSITTAETTTPLSLCSSTNSANITPRKIALLGYRSAPFVGGQGIYLKYLSRALAALGHTVDVYSGPPYPELDGNIGLIKVPSLDLFEHDNHVWALRPKHLLSYSDVIEWWSMLTGGFAEPYTFGRRVAKKLRGTHYDIIHDNQSLCFGLLALQKTGTPVVSTIHHPIHRDLEIALAAAPRWGDRLLIRRWYSFLRMQNRVVKKLKHVITVSTASQGDIEKYFHRPTHNTQVIPNGIDTETFRPLPHIQRLPHRIITTASSDQPLKGLSYLLRAIATLKPRYPKLHLHVVGKLKEDGATRKLLDELALGDSVSFVSGIATEALVEAFAKASVMVCPSLYEGFGLPVGEAMACGLPVISSDGGALPEVVGDAGIVVEKGKADAIANALTEIFDNPERAANLGTHARARIEQSFSWHAVARTLSQYYEKILC